MFCHPLAHFLPDILFRLAELAAQLNLVLGREAKYAAHDLFSFTGPARVATYAALLERRVAHGGNAAKVFSPLQRHDDPVSRVEGDVGRGFEKGFAVSFEPDFDDARIVSAQ